MLRRIVKLLKKLPVDLGQYELRYRTKGKLIAYDLVGNGAGKKALDVGCRDGYWSEKLKQKGYAVVACDIEPQYSGAIKLDANRPFPFAENEFDLAWCAEVIEHLLDPAFTIAEFKRVLKPGGLLIMTTPNQGFWVFRVFARFGVSMASLQNEEHEHDFSHADMRRLVGASNLYGYFPYALVKWRIQKAASLLSPTIVLCHTNDKRGARAGCPSVPAEIPGANSNVRSI